MTRINTNIASLVARSNLNQANEGLQVRLQRLSTGLRINRGADDPAGLIAADRLRAELRGVEQGVKNSERASNVIATTEGALSEVSDLLNSIKALVVEAANSGAFSPEEVEANQLQIDSAIDSITRISNTASFAGLKLLDGGLGYTLSGVDAANIFKANVNAANFGTRADIPVSVEVIGSAQQAQLFVDGNHPAAGAGLSGTILSTVTLEIAGPKGVQVLTFLSGQSYAAVATAINAVSDATGVKASAFTASTAGFDSLRFYSDGYGSESFISVERRGNSGAWFSTSRLRDNEARPTGVNPFWVGGPTLDVASRDTGADVVAVANGALATGRGLQLDVKTAEVDIDMLLTPTFATTVSGTADTFTVTGGGSLFQLGPSVNSAQQVNIGVQSVAASRLGGTAITLATGATELHFLSSLKSGADFSLASTNFQEGSTILDTAIDEIASLRGRLGAFERNTIETNVRSLQAAIENITAAESDVRDADFAEETAELTRSQVLASASTSVLATANANAQNVLQLLG